MGRVDTRVVVNDKASAALKNIYNNINKVNRAFDRLATAHAELNTNVTGTTRRMTNLNTKVQQLGKSYSSAAVAANSLNFAMPARQVELIGKSAQSSTKHVNTLISKLKRLATTYLGIMAARAMFTTSDDITAAGNKFTTLGTMQYGMDTASAQALSSETMDKIFNAAQASASNYTDIMSNVAKSVTLAGDAFGSTQEQQIDNAIKFQEIMAKSYALGGASAAEQASSMYQMVQALGSGVLQGDELRSVREGAPLAYQAIEKFAQGVLHTDKSLKDLASDGLITSDLVVAAILDMEDETNAAFENIQLTWAQLWTIFKNEVVYAFRPFFEQLRAIANSDSFEFIIGKATSVLRTIGSVLTMIATAIGSAFDWVQQNWNIVQPILNALFVVLIALATVALAQFISKMAIAAVMWVVNNFNMFLFIAGLALVVIYLSYVGVSAETLGQVLLALGMIGLIAGIMLNAPFILLIAIIALLAALFLMFTEQVVGGIYWIGAVFTNIGYGIANVGLGIWEVLKAVAHNIKAAFVNTWKEIQAKFWDFVGAVLKGVKKVADLCNKLLGIFGVKIDTSGLESAIQNAADKASAARDSKLDYESLSDAWKQGSSTFEYKDLGEAYEQGASVGAGIQDSINGWIGGLGGSVTDLFNGSAVSDPTATATSDSTGLMNDIANGVGDIGGSSGNTAKNTGDMAKSMDLTEEDLKYLRQIAEMEAINKFTTAEIKVDMTNNNTMNNMGDLDGIVTHLSTVLREELEVVASGVHNA